MAASRDLRSRVTDVVTCPICLELFNSPKSLPCLHTFCHKCVAGHCRTNKPGDAVACPVCRQMFNIPQSAVRGLVSNFYIADLVEARKIDADSAAVKKRVDRAKCEISNLNEERCKFLSGVEDVRNQIRSRGEELKQLIDAQVNELMAEVQSLKIETCKEIENLKDGVQIKLLAFETLSAYCSELKLKGKPCDIPRAANDLHIRATELLQNDVTLEDYRAPAVAFTPMNIQKLFDVTQNFIGRILVPRVVHTLPGTDEVVGVTSLDDELYVLRDKEQEQVDVYNTTTTTQEKYRLVRRLSVPGARYGLCDIASCKHFRCLYIADEANCCVHRVEFNGEVTKLSVNNEPWSLSVTSQFTVLVTCYEHNKLLELTTEGKQLREITLQSDIVSPQHAIQLSNGQFVVSHGESDLDDSDDESIDRVLGVHRVCIVDTNGHVTQSYGGPRGSATVGQLDEPSHLAVDKDEFIIVAELINSRVLLLSPTLNFVREIVSRDQLKGGPGRLFLDVDRRRLFVAVLCQVVVVQL